MTIKRLRPLSALLSGAALMFGASLTSPAKAEELRIGFIAPMTGIFAQVGKDMSDGFKMYLDATKDDFAGAKVKLIIEDSQAKPDLAVTKAKKLILQDKVHMLVGGVLATEGYALAPVSTNDKTVYIASIPAADDLTQRQLDKYPYFIRTGWTSSQPHHALGQWACSLVGRAEQVFQARLLRGFGLQVRRQGQGCPCRRIGRCSCILPVRFSASRHFACFRLFLFAG